MKQLFKLAVLALIVAVGLLSQSAEVSAYGMYPGMMGNMYGYGYDMGYGYGAYGPSYGYAGPYSYQFVPRSFWGHYYNPGLYYSALDYSTTNSLLGFSQGNLGMTYGFISQNSGFY